MAGTSNIVRSLQESRHGREFCMAAESLLMALNLATPTFHNTVTLP